jgi:gluconolactonase
MDASGTGDGREVIASHYQGRELNSPNDVIVGSDGSVYFTDPAPGRNSAEHGLKRPRELDFLGVFRRRPEDGGLQLIADDFTAPNGLCLSPDESVLYVNDTIGAHIRAFEVRPGGTYPEAGVLAAGIGTFRPGPQAEGLVDGMKCDVEGNIWITGPRGIWIISPQGEHLGTVHLPDFATNLHWGGENWDWLYVACVSGLYRFPTRTSARREPFMR